MGEEMAGRVERSNNQKRKEMVVTARNVNRFPHLVFREEGEAVQLGHCDILGH
jgi:hypothetical protein